jgi:hypothetical protein
MSLVPEYLFQGMLKVPHKGQYVPDVDSHPKKNKNMAMTTETHKNYSLRLYA